jgi:hypothetical protein
MNYKHKIAAGIYYTAKKYYRHTFVAGMYFRHNPAAADTI